MANKDSYTAKVSAQPVAKGTSSLRLCRLGIQDANVLQMH